MDRETQGTDIGEAERGTRSSDARAPRRILIVSDSLGTPVHPRGIFHYTANLIRALSRCGHEVVLLVERTPSHAGLDRDGAALGAFSPAALHVAELGIIYHYLDRTEFGNRYLAPPGWRLWLSRRLGLFDQAVALFNPRGLRQMMGASTTVRYGLVANDWRKLDFVPARLGHLRDVGAFAQSDSVYAIAFASACYGFAPTTIDVSAFDTVIVDTPTHLRFRHGPSTEIVAVIHDLIPLSDPNMSGMWRRIFVNKLVCTMRAADGYVFVSETTRRQVAAMFPSDDRTRKAAVLHPAVDDAIAVGYDAATPADARSADPDKNYLVAIVSDEPRKNAAALIEAMAFLPPTLGLKIIGALHPSNLTPQAAAERDRIYGAGRVELLGYLDDARKRAVLAGALGVVVPSHSEGFGIPLVEGLFFGKPTFCSDIPVFREVAGEGVFYFDPTSPPSIAAAVRSYLEAPEIFRERVAGAAVEARARFALSALERAVEARFGRAAAAAQ